MPTTAFRASLAVSWLAVPPGAVYGAGATGPHPPIRLDPPETGTAGADPRPPAGREARCKAPPSGKVVLGHPRKPAGAPWCRPGRASVDVRPLAALVRTPVYSIARCCAAGLKPLPTQPSALPHNWPLPLPSGGGLCPRLRPAQPTDRTVAAHGRPRLRAILELAPAAGAGGCCAGRRAARRRRRHFIGPAAGRPFLGRHPPALRQAAHRRTALSRPTHARQTEARKIEEGDDGPKHGTRRRMVACSGDRPDARGSRFCDSCQPG